MRVSKFENFIVNKQIMKIARDEGLKIVTVNLGVNCDND